MLIKAKSFVNKRSLGESTNPGLTPNKHYSVIGLDSENYRIINDHFEPILYPKSLFEVIDESIPNSWKRENSEDGDYYIDPPELSEPGFYEDYFDGLAYAKEILSDYVKRNNIII